MVSDTDRTLNAQEAADALGVHRNTVLNWLAAGRLHGKKVGKEWRIPSGELAKATAVDPSLVERYAASGGAADFLAGWIRNTELIAAADLILAARGFVAAWADCETVVNGAPVVQREKLENTEAQLTTLRTKLAALDRVRSLAPLLRALESESLQLGRAVDAETDAAVEAQKAMREQLRTK